MLKLIAKLQTRLNEDKGATLVEYGLITGLIIAIAVAAMVILGDGIDAMFTEVGADVNAAF